MTEREYLEELRLRINQSNDLSSLGYCDHLKATRYFLGPPEPRMEGTVYFVGDRFGQLRFKLLLPEGTASLDGIEWHVILPTQGSRGWAQFDDGMVTIDVSAASFDPSPRVAHT